MKLKKFVINDLYGYKKVNIDFTDNIKILIGENGLGKTTVLNALYFAISQKFDRLAKISFSSIELHIDSKKKITLRKDKLLSYLNRNKENSRSHFSQLLTKLTPEQVKILRNVIENNNLPMQHKRIELQDSLKKIGVNIDAPTNFIFDLVLRYFSELDANDFFKVIKELNDYVDCKILYFPTYRRIEEELKNIGVVSRKELNDKYSHFLTHDLIDNKITDEDIIQFGMSDVEERIESITSEIAHSSILGFSDITADMLHQLLTDFPDVIIKKQNKIDLNKLKIILERVGPNISADDKNKIVEFIEKGETSNKGLVYFINKLIDLYNKQESQDFSIKSFVEVCNNYLSDKKYVYNEREVSLRIERTRDNSEKIEIVELNELSSGEKQIVSLFSKIYLEKNDRYIVLFDEPELSLSIFWQMRLLPDILKSKKCDLLVAVTHSPFIYDNELSEYAIGLNEYIR